MKPTLFSIIAAAAALAAFSFTGPAADRIAAAATPPPTPPPIDNPVTATPVPSGATPAPASATSLPSPSATVTLGPAAPAPTPAGRPKQLVNARKGLDGVWEVQIQHPTVTDYTHLKIQQVGDALTGTYLDAQKHVYPLSGSVDGTDVRMIVSMPDGTTILLEGRLDGTTDMLGMLTTPTGQVPFTAAYRAKEKWIENVNPSPGGISQPGAYTPP